MKLDQLRKIIREEVKAAVKEELQEVMTEAVRIASTPTTEESVISQQYRQPLSKPVEKHKQTSNTPVMEMLEETRAAMTNEEYKNIYTGNSDMVQKPSFASSIAYNMGINESGPEPGIDLSNLDFLKKAGSIYKAAVQKDKEKYGVI